MVHIGYNDRGSSPAIRRLTMTDISLFAKPSRFQCTVMRVVGKDQERPVTKRFKADVLIVPEYNCCAFPLRHWGFVQTIVLIEYLGSGTCTDREKQTFLPRFLLVYALTEVGKLKHRELQHEFCFHVYFEV